MRVHDSPRAGGGEEGSGTMALSRNLLVAVAAAAPALGVGGREPRTPEPGPGREPAALSRVAFEENLGQAEASVRFVGRGRGVVALIGDGGADLLLGRGGVDRARLRIGTADSARPGAEGAALPGPAHYLRGRDPAKWVRGVRRFPALRAPRVAPGADLLWRGSAHGLLRFDLHLAPGTDPATVPIAIEGARSLSVDGAGRLVAELPRGTLALGRPRLWQESGHRRLPVEGRFAVRDGFAVVEAAAFDRSLPLVVDPTLEYGSYLGGSGDDSCFAARVDGSGVLHLAGTATNSFPLVNPYDSTSSGGWDTVVAKVAADGSALLYATYLGGNGSDTPRDLAVDAGGAVVVVGETISTDFPAVNAIQGTGVIGSGMPPIPEGYASRLSPDGSLLEWSTYLGGQGARDVAHGVVLDSGGNAFVVGEAGSSNFPTASPIQGTKGAGTDAFVMRISPTGSLAWSTFLGGGGDDGARGVSLDSAGSLLVAGATASNDFPVLAGGFQTVKASGSDAFVLRMPATGLSLTWCTYVGGSGNDVARAVVEGRNGSTWAAGDSTSTNFPVVVNGVQPNQNGGSDAFVVRLGAGGATLQYGTYLGGGFNDTAARIALDSIGAVCVAGTTESVDFPTAAPLQGTFGGGSSDFFFARLHPSGAPLLCSTFLGGAGADAAEGFAFAPDGSLWLAGLTTSSAFPLQSELDSVRGGSVDFGLARIRMNPPAAPTGVHVVLEGPGEVSVKWLDPTGGLCPFEIERKDSPAAPFLPRASLPAGSLTLLDSTVPPGQTVTWRVRSVDHGGPSTWSSTPATAVPPLPPEAPSGLTAAALGPTTVRLNWTDNSARESAVVVHRREPGGIAAPVFNAPADAVTADAPARPHRAYLWSVTAENAGGVSAPSNEVAAATPASFGYLLRKGKLKYVLDPGGDSLAVKAVLGAGAGGPAPNLDPRAQGFELYLGGRSAPAVISIPPGDPGWKVRKTKYAWKSAKGVLPKVKVAFNAAKGTLAASVAKTDLPATTVSSVFLGVDMGPSQAAGGTDPWTPKKTGQSKYP